MTTEKEIIATDLEDFDEVDVVEVLIAPGDEIEKGQSIVTLESDKAMMEFPSSAQGTVKSIEVAVGDKVKQGDVLVTLTQNEDTAETNEDGEDKQEADKNKQVGDKQVTDNKKNTEKKDDVEVKQKTSEKTEVQDKTITATDLEDFDEVEVVEVLVASGEEIEKGQSIVTLESDKAMMEFPSSAQGIVKSIEVKVGDKVKQGDALIVLSSQEQVDTEEQADEKEDEKPEETTSENEPESNTTEESQPVEKSIVATELEDFDEVDVVEILVAEGDKIEKNQSIVTLESDKAMMEFPSPENGEVLSISVKAGDKVKQGDELIVIKSQGKSQDTTNTKTETKKADKPDTEQNKPASESNNKVGRKGSPRDAAYASPMVRKYAGELGVDLEEVSGSEQHGRVVKDDVQDFVRKRVSGTTSKSYKQKEQLPDFSQFGTIEEVSLNKLRQISAQRLTQSWQEIPHVTQFEEADITDLDHARKQLKPQVEEIGAKLTILPFIMKALVKCLTEYPDFNSSINESVTGLIHKKYFHIGIAVDTPRGLLVPVIKDVDQKKIPELAQELMDISDRARNGSLSAKDMRGGCMSITSLGGIGGQYFTPIINQPEVAILGVSKAETKLQKVEGEIVEKLMLPLSLSYDHRAIDGVAAVKFILGLKNKLNDVWSLML